MCDNKLTQDSAFSYLEEIRTLFLDTFTQKEIESAYSYTLNDKFREPIKGKMSYYNANLNESDKVSKLKKGVLDYKDTVLQATDVLMERGEKINLIVKKADNLRTESVNYYSSAKKVKSTVKCRNIKIAIFGIIILLLVAYFISVIACGWDWSKCRSEK
jgi:vesicle-associated membrane protein 7